ncbi:MAG TPA: DHHA1 domain-containing protein, partial [Thermomicrobiales bacterium]|nr:DHHA1 domain-containing protein [Thermomicrobiales bacterium]
AGRVGATNLALALLRADGGTTAPPPPVRLGDLNEHRRNETRRVQDEAEAQLHANGWVPADPAIVVAGSGWSNGIVGLVASRLVERYHRPAIVLEHVDDIVRGSARSVPGVDIVRAIEASSEILDRFGGHAAAAGLSLRYDALETFVRELKATVLDLCGGQLPEREIFIDAEAGAADLHLGTVDLLERLEPFGQGNEEPRVIVRDVAHRYAKTSRDGRHLLLRVVDERNRSHRAVFFGAGHRLAELEQAPRIDIATRLQRDTWDDRTSLKLHLDDFRPAQ